MDCKTTFKFYAVKDVPFVGAYKAGSFNANEPQILFAMDFHTWMLKDVPKEELTEAFKDGMLQCISHEFIHSMQEMLDKEYDELEVERIMGAYKSSWNVFEAPSDDEELTTGFTFSIRDLLWMVDESNAKTVDEFKQEIYKLFGSHKLWIDAEKKHDE